MNYHIIIPKLGKEFHFIPKVITSYSDKHYMRVIVSRISKESLEKLIELGYTVIIR